MKIPVHITFHGVDHSAAVDEYVRRRAAKLETFSDRITCCRVALEVPHHRHLHGDAYRVRIELRVPRADLVVGHSPDTNESRDIYAAIDDAFDRAGRVLQDYVRKQRGEIKTHADQR